ncbi:MAG TPA: valine--tRNA ligase [Actinospica sp.]|nr:valine--tRNA ligase [Actinospica sp.]
MPIPERPSVDGLDEKWSKVWADAGTYRFVAPESRERVYSIDTPPPTVSGSLHVGHVFSYTHTDLIARYQRMRGRHVFYPMGWDDNGLPTERRVQNHFGVRCEPSLPYEPDLRLTDEPQAVSRRNFIELCETLTAEDERAFEHLWRRLGLSVDWSRTYTTIGARARKVAQTGFLRLLAKGEVYQSEAPTMWDVDFQTAVSNAEMEDRERDSAYHRLRFTVGDTPVFIETTRPELLPACVALVAHPDDERYQGFFGQEATTPIFGVRVPVHAHPLAQPDKGSGIAMVCTFGDQTDIQWWRELGLATRTIVGRDGRLRPLDFDTPEAQRIFDGLVGLTTNQARKAILELLGDTSPRPIKHPVKYYEKGDRPLEIVSSRQWFIRTMAHRDELLARGNEITWHPAFMKSRYDDWVTGLAADWLISRQRYFGVPFPLWYPLDAEGLPDHARPILPDEADLPVDPQSAAPAGYTEARRGVPGGFTGEPDIMDTWATSSLTPQLATGWLDDPELHALTFPMDLRPQAHEIIRTWLFSTVVRSMLEEGATPWQHTAIAGWILDPDRKKMSKSQGNVVTPEHLIDEFGADGVRYWAALGRPGTDTAFEPRQMKVGRRLATKVLNAAKFVYGFEAAAADAVVTEPLDAALIDALKTTITEATAAFDAYEYTTALAVTERLFWTFCDDYVELVKERAYAGSDSARLTLRLALGALLRLLAPFLPYATEEVWSWTHQGSIHTSAWPTPDEWADVAGDRRLLDAASAAIGAVRKAKTDAKLSMRTEVASAVVAAAAGHAELIRGFENDLRAAGRLGAIEYAEADELAVRLG